MATALASREVGHLIRPSKAACPDLGGYDTIIVAFSGGKDSVACLLSLIEAGIPRARIELHHHDVDGQGPSFMDWPCTTSYCRSVAGELEVPVYLSWKEGGFLREMLRDGEATAPIHFQTRERAEESRARAAYATFEPHRTDTRESQRRPRHVDHWRPVHHLHEREVWALMRRHGIVPAPAYRLGWSRLSCLACIFGGPDQWASLRAIAPARFERIAAYEERFGCTIQRHCGIRALADRGRPYLAAVTQPDLAHRALCSSWTEPVRIPSRNWQLPAGAFGHSRGPS